MKSKDLLIAIGLSAIMTLVIAYLNGDLKKLFDGPEAPQKTSTDICVYTISGDDGEIEAMLKKLAARCSSIAN